jgi:hypothetical protein
MSSNESVTESQYKGVRHRYVRKKTIPILSILLARRVQSVIISYMYATSLCPESSSSHQLGQFLHFLDKCTHDLLMIALDLKMDSEQSNADKQNKIKTEILKRTVKGGTA